MDLLRSLPLGLYLEHPITWLHHLDSRVKLAWLMSFLAAPLLATPEWRLLLMGLLILLTLSARIPLRVWRQQMGWLLLLGIYVFSIVAIAPDGLSVESRPRLPENELTFQQQPAALPPPPPAQWRLPFLNVLQGQQSEGALESSAADLKQEFTDTQINNPLDSPPRIAQQSSQSPPEPTPEQQEKRQQALRKEWTDKLQRPNLPQPTGYSYVLFQRGPIKITRRSLDLAIRVSTLLFTLIYSTTLYLLTTSPEEVTAGLEDLLSPLRRFNLPITEITLTLTLSLRFIPLVLEEFQNLVRSIRTRAINWKKLGFKRTTQVWMLVAERLLENLLLRAEQIASAMKVRGFTSPNHHRVQWHNLQLRRWDWVALGGLGLLWTARLLWGGAN